MNAPYKVLIIGASGFPKGVDCVSFSNLPNIAEYDKVFLNLTALDAYAAVSLSEDPNFSLEAIHHLLWKGGDFIVITDGKMEFDLGASQETIEISAFFPIEVPLESSEGTSINPADSEFKDYHSHVGQWKFFLKHQPEIPSQKIQQIFSQNEINHIYNSSFPWRLEYKITGLATNGFQQPVSFALQYMLISRAFQENRLEKKSGRFIYLQPPNKTGALQNAINTILECWGIQICSVAPNWLYQYTIPGEKDVEDEINQLEKSKSEIQKKIDGTSDKLKCITRFKKILYENGDELVKTVWDYMEALGFKVDRHDKSQEDGTMEDTEGYTYVLEIKGKENGAATKDLRELHDWVDRYLERTGIAPKGVFILNHHRLVDPRKRAEPFPDDFLKMLKAKKDKDLVVTSTQLFELYKKVLSGTLAKEKVLQSFKTQEGIYKLI